MAAKFIGKDILILKKDTKIYTFGSLIEIKAKEALIESPYEPTKWYPLDAVYYQNAYRIHRVKDLIKKSLKKKKMREKRNLQKN
jgi:hypothetical protein